MHVTRLNEHGCLRKDLCTLENKPHIRYVFFEDLNFGWVINQTQYRILKTMVDQFEFPNDGSFFTDRTLSDLSFV